MSYKLTADDINQEPIENILNVLKVHWFLNFKGNKLLLEWTFSTRYRFSRKLNRVKWFNIELPEWKPFNFVKTLLYAYLWEKEAISQTFKWFRWYFGIDDDFKSELKMNAKLVAEIKRNAEINKRKAEKDRRRLLARRKTFWIKFSRLKKYYSENTIEYFENRCISKKILEINNAKTWIIIHNWKIYKNRIFFPMNNEINDIIWIKMRNLYAKDPAYKSINITDSWSWLLYRKEDIEWQETIYFCEWEIDKMSMDEAWITNSIWNMMWANTFDDNWKELFKDCKNINVLYDFDKNSLAWLQWVRKIMRTMPGKNIKFLDLPKYLHDNFPEDRGELLNEFSDINDIWVSNNMLWKDFNYFKNTIDTNLCKKSIEELNKIILNFDIQNKKEKDLEIGDFKLSFKSKIKSLDDFIPKIS